jgi:hypothetical protein
MGEGQTRLPKDRGGRGVEATEAQMRGRVEQPEKRCVVVSKTVRQSAYSRRCRHGASGEAEPEKPVSSMAVSDPKETKWAVSASTG